MTLVAKAEEHLHRLCQSEDRRMGSESNRLAVHFFAEVAASFGWQVECPRFECIDWKNEGVSLVAGKEAFHAQASPYSLGCCVEAPLVVVSTLAELESVDVGGKILLMQGEIAREQLFPKNFPFYNPEEHKHIIHLLETKLPAAIVAATFRNPEMAGAVYPFPLIEDGDFDIPSVYMTDREGIRLEKYAGEIARLESRASRIPSTGCNVVARKGKDDSKRIVLTAHIDTKIGTPGALDNASGATTLLLIAELLMDRIGNLLIEIVLLNGEDYFASSGEILYLTQNQEKLGDILLEINMDGVGSVHGKTAYSLYGCSDELAGVIRPTLSVHDELFEGDPWYQGDHTMFIQKGIPALALTSGQFNQLWEEVAHTPRDTPDIVDPAKLVELATALCDLIEQMGTWYDRK